MTDTKHSTVWIPRALSNVNKRFQNNVQGIRLLYDFAKESHYAGSTSIWSKRGNKKKLIFFLTRFSFKVSSRSWSCSWSQWKDPEIICNKWIPRALTNVLIYLLIWTNNGLHDKKRMIHDDTWKPVVSTFQK